MNTEVFAEQFAALAKQMSFSEDFVLPDYDGPNVRNLSTIVGSVFGVSPLTTGNIPKHYVDSLDGVKKIVLVILDGLGYRRLLTHMQSHDGTFAELAQKGVMKPLTTVFPSTTSTVLTSIFTGLTPAEHGIIGYQMFSKEYGLVFNTLDMKPAYGYSSQIDLADDFSRRIDPWMPILQEHDVASFIVTKGSIAGSGLSRIIHRDQAIIPYRLHSDMLVQCYKALKTPVPTLLTVYYSGIDNLEHKYGPYSEEVTFELRSLECNLKIFFEKLPDEIKRQTLILITSDHGVAETQNTLYLKDIPDISNRLMLPPLGDSRSTFLFANPGQDNALEEAFRRQVQGFKLFPSSDLVKANAFGKTKDQRGLSQSLGDLTALSNSRNALQYPLFEDDRNFEHLGSHGGMTAEEMIVPLLSARLSNL